MLPRFALIGILLLSLINMYSMERPVLKELAIKKVAELITCNPNPRYCVKVFDTLPLDLSTLLVQYIMLTNKHKSALSVLLLSYKHYYQQQQQQNNINQRIRRLLLANNQQVQLTSEQSRELIQTSATIQNITQNLKEQIEEIPLPLFTQEQVTNLLPYIPITNALNTSNSVLPEIPETAAVSVCYLKHTAQRQLKEYLTTQTILMLYNLIIAASYLDIHSNEPTVNLADLATQALGDKLLQAPQYQEQYAIISTLPHATQYMLVQYIIQTSAVHYTLCSSTTSPRSIVTGYTNAINSLSWSTCNSKIASSSDGVIKIWDAAKGTSLRTLSGHNDRVRTIVWSPNGEYIASGSDDETIQLWNTVTGANLYTFSGYSNTHKSISWSPDSSTIAIGSGNEIKICDTTGKCSHILIGQTTIVNALSWSPDGKYIASGSQDGTLGIWDTTTGKCTRTLETPTLTVPTASVKSVSSVSWSSNGKYIASCSYKTIKVWDAITGTCIHTLTGHTSYISSVSWLPHGNYITSWSYDNTVRVWDAISGACIYNRSINTIDTLASWSPDGNMLVTGSDDKTIQIWTLVDQQRMISLQNALSWEQALLLFRIVNASINKQDTKDSQTCQCYATLPEEIKQLIYPLLHGAILTTQ